MVFHDPVKWFNNENKSCELLTIGQTIFVRPSLLIEEAAYKILYMRQHILPISDLQQIIMAIDRRDTGISQF